MDSKPIGIENTARGDAPLKPADPLKNKHVSKYKLKFDEICLQKKKKYLLIELGM